MFLRATLVPRLGEGGFFLGLRRSVASRVGLCGVKNRLCVGESGFIDFNETFFAFWECEAD